MRNSRIALNKIFFVTCNESSRGLIFAEWGIYCNLNRGHIKRLRFSPCDPFLTTESFMNEDNRDNLGKYSVFKVMKTTVYSVWKLEFIEWE